MAGTKRKDKMKLIENICNWTGRNLKWMVPVVVLGLVFIWVVNANVVAIGHWLWLAWHGQKAFEIEVALMVVLASILVGIILWMLVESYRKDKL